VCVRLSSVGYGSYESLMCCLSASELVEDVSPCVSSCVSRGVSTGVSPGVSSCVSTDVSSCVSTDVSSCVSTDVSPCVSTDVSPGVSTGVSPGVSTGVSRESVNVSTTISNESSSVVKESAPYKQLALPWCCDINEKSCLALKKDLGLYTQCKKNRKESSSYCVSCIRSIDRNGGRSVFGTVSDRMKCGIMEYKDPQGNCPISFTRIMKKNNLSRASVELEARRLNKHIPECHFDEKIEKRGRPKKEKSNESCQTETTSTVEDKKKRGRPKKEKEIISNEAGEDLIASLMKDVSCTESEPILEEEEEEETIVVKIEINGTTYLKSEDNVLYDMNSHEGVGIWNEKTKEIEIIPDDEE
jgi:hypothetical protein